MSKQAGNHFLKKSISRILKRPNRVIKRTLVTLANLYFNGGVSFATQVQGSTVKYSDLFGKVNNLDINQVYHDWQRSDAKWNEGFYSDSCKIRKNILERIYVSQKIGSLTQVPTFLSIEWSAAIGHMGSLGTFVIGQKLGVVPNSKRYLPVRDEEQARRIETIFQDQVGLLQMKNGFTLLENPSHWHLSERLQMIRTLDDFIDLYDLHERVYQRKDLAELGLVMKLSESYENLAREKLEALGLPRGAWFVGLHVRGEPNPLDPRKAEVRNFGLAVDEITSQGGWVIRFGTNIMDPLGKSNNLVDLNPNSPEYRYLHLFVIAKSRFFLTTNGGPSFLGWAFGTPVLQTNTLSIGRNILSSSRDSLFLPKNWERRNGEKISYCRLVMSLEGYNETDLKQKSKDGYTLRENTAIEIRDATRDMFDQLNYKAPNCNLDSKLHDLRTSVKAVGHGVIAPSYLSANENWFLN